MNNNYLFRFFCLLSLVTVALRANAQYCNGAYVYTSCNSYDWCQSFSTTGGSTNISNLNSGCTNNTNNYNLFNQTVTQIKGNSVGFTILNNPYYGEYYGIFIDYNQDNDFVDAGEQVYAGYLGYGASATNSFTIPLTAATGTTRLRLKCAYDGAPSPCANYYYGETEDYYINLVNPCAGPNITVQPQNRQYCDGGTAAFSLTATATGTITYKWQVNSGSGFTNITDNSVYSGSSTSGLSIANLNASYNNYQYRCIATSACGTPVTSAMASLSRYPTLSITSQPSNVTTCAGVTSSASITAAGATNYRWQIGSLTGGYADLTDGAVFSGTNTGILNMFETPSNLAGSIIRCIVQGPCNDDTTTDIPLVLLLTPEFSQQPQNITIPTGNNVYFEVTVNTNGNAVQYYWQASYDSINFYNIQKNSLYNKVDDHVLEMLGVSLAQSGMFFRCIIKSTGGNCGDFADTSDISKLIVTNPSSVNDLDGGAGISVYPNPVTGNDLYIQAEKATIREMDVRIIDKLGKTVYSGDIHLSQNNTATVPVTRLPPGIYTIQLGKGADVIQAIQFTKQ